MNDQPGPDVKLPDPLEISRMMAKLAEQSQRLVGEFLKRQTENPALGLSDPLNLGQAFFDMTARMMTQPTLLMQAQLSLWQDYMSLWQSAAKRMMGEPAAPVITPAEDDRRFKDALWDESFIFDFIKQSYLLSARWMQSTVKKVEGLDDKTAKKVDFYTCLLYTSPSPRD